MKKILQSILCLGAFSVPTFSEVTWDLGLNTNNKNVSGFSQNHANVHTLELLSATNTSVEYKLNSRVRVGVESASTTSTHEVYDIDSNTRIMRLSIIHIF